MTNLGIQYSTTRPSELELTDNAVYLASNITPYSKEIEGHTITGYSYEYTKYDKDEYILKLQQDILDT